MKILYMSTNLSNPVSMGRVEMLRGKGIEVEVMGYEREEWTSQGFPRRSAATRHTVLGLVRSGKHKMRIPKMLRNLPEIRRAVRRNDLVYVYGADLTFLSRLAGLGLHRPLVQDVLDIREILLAPGMKGRMVRMVHGAIESRCGLLVLTAPSYRDYYRDWLGIDVPDLVVENKVAPSLAAEWRNRHTSDMHDAHKGLPLVDRPLRIGWFAEIRHVWPIEFVEHLARMAGGKFEIVVAGVIATNIEERYASTLEKSPDIDYLGPFERPDSLYSLYTDVDMALACYPPELPNGWSRSCRFYDSLAFGKPLIVREGTGDARLTRTHQLGMVLHESDPRRAAEELAAIAVDDWLQWKANVRSLAPEIYTRTDEAERLDRELKALSASGQGSSKIAAHTARLGNRPCGGGGLAGAKPCPRRARHSAASTCVGSARRTRQGA